MKEKITGIILFFVLIAPVIITFGWLQLEKAHIRKAVKWHILHHINKEELALLKFTQEETKSVLKWKHSREFEWQNKMYDIVSQESKGDSIFFWCFADEEENCVNAKIAAFISVSWQDNPSKKEQEKRLANYYKSLFIGNDIPENSFRGAHDTPAFCTFSSEDKRIENRPPTPPPQV